MKPLLLAALVLAHVSALSGQAPRHATASAAAGEWAAVSPTFSRARCDGATARLDSTGKLATHIVSHWGGAPPALACALPPALRNACGGLRSRTAAADARVALAVVCAACLLLLAACGGRTGRAPRAGAALSAARSRAKHAVLPSLLLLLLRQVCSLPPPSPPPAPPPPMAAPTGGVCFGVAHRFMGGGSADGTSLIDAVTGAGAWTALTYGSANASGAVLSLGSWGGADVVPSPISLGLGGVTLATWVYVNQYRGQSGYACTWSISDGINGLQLMLQSSQPSSGIPWVQLSGSWTVAMGGMSINSGRVLPVRTWAHLALTMDVTGASTVYVNGVPAGTSNTHNA